jgi:hypothetical protein
MKSEEFFATAKCLIIVIIRQGREDIFLSRGSSKKRGLKLSSLAWCIYYFFHY